MHFWLWLMCVTGVVQPSLPQEYAPGELNISLHTPAHIACCKELIFMQAFDKLHMQTNLQCVE